MEEKSQLVYNLLALGFDINSKELKYNCQFDENMFNMPNKRAFEVVTHFLLDQLDHKNALKLFRACFPGTDKKSAQEFRKVTFNWLKKLSEENASFGMPKVSSTLLMSPGGQDFVHLMFMLSVFVLHKKTTLLQPNGILYPPVQFKTQRRANAQMKTIQALTETNFKELQKQMQLTKKAEENLQEFTEQQINTYHALQRKKKLLINEKKAMLGTAANYSELKQTEFKKLRNRNLAGKIEQARNLWNTLAEIVNETAPHRDVIESVLNEETEIKLDGNTLHPVIPAKLLDACQEEIYQTVGTSLYANGHINLNSLVTLENMSLELLADTIHSESFPNFDKQNAWLKTRFRLHEDELNKLTTLLTNMEEEKAEKLSSIRDAEKELDAIYRSKCDEASDIGLDVPDASSDYGKSRLSSDEIDLTKYEDISPCKEGIAAKYFLPAGNPNSFLESLLDDSITNSSRSDDANDVTSTPLRQQQQNFEGWVIPAAPDLSSSYRRTPKPLKSTKKENPMHSLRKTGKPLKQGKTKRLDSAIKSRNDWAKDFSAQLRETLPSSCHASPRKKKRGRLSVSLPSSPLMTYRSDDVVVQKVTSRTPEAERKLVDQIVSCTCDDNDSPLVVYETEGRSQLDRSAFVSRDMIPRTPLKVNILPPQDLSFSRESYQYLSDSSSDVEDCQPFPSCETTTHLSSKVPKTDYASDIDIAKASVLSPSSISSTVTSNQSKDINKNSFSSLFSGLNITGNDTAAISSNIDSVLDSFVDGNPPSIMDISTPLFTDSFELETKKFEIPTTNTLVALDEPDSSNYIQANSSTGKKSNSQAVDLLMSTPPLPEEADSRKENKSPFLVASASKNPAPLSPERPQLQQFPLNLLPVPDIGTPEMQHFKSVLKRK